LKAVCDTSVLIALDALEKTQILKDIFSDVIIPEGVHDELKTEQVGFKFPTWIEIKRISNMNFYRSLRSKIDKGESEAISLSLEEKSDFVLLDDKEARKAAVNFDLKVIGTVGLLLLAKKKKLILSVTEEIHKLEERINFRLSEDLKDYIINEAGE
jgi:predicted nucleic acid-binding protein